MTASLELGRNVVCQWRSRCTRKEVNGSSDGSIVTAARPVIHVVDDDASVRTALERLLRAVGFEVETFASSQEFLDCGDCSGPGCLILDVQMPGMNGLDLEERLAASGSKLSVIYITAFDEPESRERAKRQGAVAFLTKPFDDEVLLGAIRTALGAETES